MWVLGVVVTADEAPRSTFHAPAAGLLVAAEALAFIRHDGELVSHMNNLATRVAVTVEGVGDFVANLRDTGDVVLRASGFDGRNVLSAVKLGGLFGQLFYVREWLSVPVPTIFCTIIIQRFAVLDNGLHFGGSVERAFISEGYERITFEECVHFGTSFRCVRCIIGHPRVNDKRICNDRRTPLQIPGCRIRSTERLTSDPTQAMDAVTKQYVDQAVESGVGGAAQGGLFFTDATPTSTGIVGSKTYVSNTVPANAVITEATTDTNNVTVTLYAEGGSAFFSPTVTITTVPEQAGGPIAATLTVNASDRRTFTATANLTGIAEDTVITATSSTNATTTMTIHRAVAGPNVNILQIDSLPGSQTEAKSGDTVTFSGRVPNSATYVEVIAGGAAFLHGPLHDAGKQDFLKASSPRAYESRHSTPGE